MFLKCVLVSYDGSDSADAMLRLACHLAGSQGRIVALAITRAHRSLPLDTLPAYFDEPGLRALQRAWKIADELAVDIDLRLRRAYDAANTILREAQIAEADAIFLATKPRRMPWLRARLDGTARSVLKQASFPVLVGHFPPLEFSSTDVIADANRVLHRAHGAS